MHAHEGFVGAAAAGGGGGGVLRRRDKPKQGLRRRLAWRALARARSRPGRSAVLLSNSIERACEKRRGERRSLKNARAGRGFLSPRAVVARRRKVSRAALERDTHARARRARRSCRFASILPSLRDSDRPTHRKRGESAHSLDSQRARARASLSQAQQRWRSTTTTMAATT